MRRIGDMPFDFNIGSCGTFMIETLLTILLCFSGSIERKTCRSLTITANGPLSSINDFIFEDERVVIPDSTYDHWMAPIASYQGFPLIVGGTNNNKLEMLDTTKNPPEWIQYDGTDYPYQNE